MKQFNFASLGAYLFRGTFIVAPIFATAYAIFSLLRLIDSPVQQIFFAIFGFRIYGLGIITILVLLIAVGYLGSILFVDRFLKAFERLIYKIPLVKEIYKSLRDIIGAFVSDKKKFEKPVLVETSPNIFRIGFITNEDLQDFHIEKEIISVYFPLSYAFTGELLLVKKAAIQHLQPQDVGSLMKFVISGGIVHREEEA
jgi:uncharacterized membrane protein